MSYCVSKFTNIEIEEIINYIEDTDGMSINGRNITCFKNIYCLVTGEIVNISNVRLLEYIEQIQLLKESLETFGCDDCSFFDKLILFLENKKS